MDKERHWRQMLQYKPEAWRDDQTEVRSQRSEVSAFASSQRPELPPNVREQTRVLELLGRVNYKIIKGSKVYIEVDGVVYKTLYGGYWRSVFTGIEHYLLRCEQVSGSVWAEDNLTGIPVDLPIAYTNEGWTASGHSLSFMLSRDLVQQAGRSFLGLIPGLRSLRSLHPGLHASSLMRLVTHVRRHLSDGRPRV
jgi:hypothetical protein